MKSLVLIRHAHRDTTLGKDRDNGLSVRGKKQRKRLAKYFFRNHADKSLLLFSSPSLRCIETLASISRKSQISTEIHKDLREHGKGESSEEFKKRIRSALREFLKEQSEIVLLCSHGDWIPTAVSILIGIEIGLSKCGWVEFEVHGDEIRLKNLLQKPE